jgi:hypothetical protein
MVVEVVEADDINIPRAGATAVMARDNISKGRVTQPANPAKAKVYLALPQQPVNQRTTRRGPGRKL